jgi:hypothetical protein
LTLLSSHPLPGKRIQILTYYAEQLDLDTEYGMDLIRQELRQLDRRGMQRQFWGELGLLSLPGLGLLTGLIWTQYYAHSFSLGASLGFGFGVGLLLQTLIFIVRSRHWLNTELLPLLCDPSLSPLGTQGIKCQGKLNRISNSLRQTPKLYFQDRTAVMPASFPLWYQFWQRLKSIFAGPNSHLSPILNQRGQITASFHRGLSPSLMIDSIVQADRTIRLYPYLSQGLVAIILIVLSLTVFKK